VIRNIVNYLIASVVIGKSSFIIFQSYSKFLRTLINYLNSLRIAIYDDWHYNALLCQFLPMASNNVWCLSQSFPNLLIIKKPIDMYVLFLFNVIFWHIIFYFWPPVGRIPGVFTLVYPPWIIYYGLHNVVSDFLLMTSAVYVQVGTTVQVWIVW
jgi:hypothetical protein